MKLYSKLIELFQNREYRRAYVDDFTDGYLATQIKVLREQRGLTQAELAAEIGVRQSQISRWENVNNTAWQVRTLKRIAGALDVALVVRFETFGSMLTEIGMFGRAALQRPAFDEDPVFARTRRQADVTISTGTLSYEECEFDSAGAEENKAVFGTTGLYQFEVANERIA